MIESEGRRQRLIRAIRPGGSTRKKRILRKSMSSVLSMLNKTLYEIIKQNCQME
jgi:hypothetical protein